MPTCTSRNFLRWAACLAAGFLHAQAPLVSDPAQRLQAAWLEAARHRPVPAAPAEGASLSVGLLSISREDPGPWMPLIHGQGQGSVTLGRGLALQAGWTGEGWTLDATATFLEDPDSGFSRGRLLTFSAVKRTEAGWRWGLEKQPLRWGHGLFGGFLLGDAADPVPRLLLESPGADLSLLGVPLGTWRFETFLGQLEWDRRIPAWNSSPATMAASLAYNGNLRRPNLSGTRLVAAFGPHVDMTFGVVSEWGGVDSSGRNIMKGIQWWNYPLGHFGAEDLVIAEASGNPNQDHPDPTWPLTYNPRNFHSISNALANIDLLIRFPETARWFGAEGMAAYLSRGAVSVNWHWKDFLRHPFQAWSHDLRAAGDRLAHHPLGSDPDSLWGYGYSQSTPALAHINDTLGVQWVFDTWDLGLELADLHNQPFPASTFRVYGHGRNLSGHSRFGDSLGDPLGGETYHQGLSLGLRLADGTRLVVQALDAIRFYRDSPLTTPGFVPGVDDHFWHLQVEAQRTFSQGRLGGSFALERHLADRFIPGNRASNWILSLGYAILVL